MKKYASLHTHTTLSVLDSTSTYEQMVDRAVECGVSALAFTEHGNIYAWIKKKQYCEKRGIKYIHGIEFYMTEEHGNKTRDNYHVIMLAKNWEGVLEINKLYTQSTVPEQTYYKNRISFDQFLSTSDNIIRLSACLGGVLHKLPEDHPRYDELLNKFDFLEIHNHIQDEQIAYNKKLLAMDKPIVFAGDFHEVSDYKAKCRVTWKTGKGIAYEGEDAFDLVMRPYDDVVKTFEKQAVLTPEQIKIAMDNTLVIADMCEEYELDETFKFPDLYEDAEEMIIEQTYMSLEQYMANGWIDKSKEEIYRERIETELHAFRTLGMESFILFMSEVMSKCVQEGWTTGPARGSASGSVVCYLLNVTDVDPIVWGTNFTRFINVNRISLPDIDTDFAPEDRGNVFKYIQDRFGVEQSAYISTYQKLGVKKVIEDIGRALSIPIPEVAAIKDGYKDIEEREVKLKKKFDNGGMSEDAFNEEYGVLEKEMEDYLSRFDNIFYYYEGLKGTVSAVGYHPAGMIGSPIDLVGNVGMRKHESNGGWVASCDMKAVDGLNYVKYDVLGLKTMQVIKHAYRLLGHKRVPRSHEMNWNDQDVFASMALSPVGLFQFEADDAWNNLINFGCTSVKDIALASAVLRPSCASFRHLVIQRLFNKNSDERIDGLLAHSLGYLVYQEDQIAFLQKMCGFTEGQADVVRRAIGKKDPVLLAEWLPKIEAGYLANSYKSESEAKEDFQQFLRVFMDAVDYSFSYNHAIAYSMITYMAAYLRHYHPKEFIAAYLNNASDESDIKAGTELAKYCGIEILNPKYGSSQGKYSISGNAIYKGIESVLYVSNNCAEALLEVSKNDLDFQGVVRHALASRAVNMRQLKVLIKCDFFSQFGAAKKLYEWLLRYEDYGSKKQLSKETLPSGTRAIIESFLNNGTPGFSETAKMYRFNAEALMGKMFDLMKNIDYSPSEKIVHQLSYLGYIQDDALLDIKVGTIMTNKSKNDSFMIKFIDGSGAWIKFGEDVECPSKGDMIVIYREAFVKNGRYAERTIFDYEQIILDRQTQKKK